MYNKVIEKGSRAMPQKLALSIMLLYLSIASSCSDRERSKTKNSPVKDLTKKQHCQRKENRIE